VLSPQQSFFSSPQIRKDAVPDLLSHPGAQPPVNTKCSGLLSCYMLYLPLARAPQLTTEKGCFAYSLCVMHFRKTINKQKIGSQRNGFTVIQKSGYQVAYYEHGK